MSIKTGESIPEASFKQMTSDGIVDISTRSCSKARRSSSSQCPAL